MHFSIIVMSTEARVSIVESISDGDKGRFRQSTRLSRSHMINYLKELSYKRKAELKRRNNSVVKAKLNLLFEMLKKLL